MGGQVSEQRELSAQQRVRQCAHGTHTQNGATQGMQQHGCRPAQLRLPLGTHRWRMSLAGSPALPLSSSPADITMGVMPGAVGL